MTKKSPEDILKQQLDNSSAAAAKALDGFQKLAALNMETARASLEQSAEQINALLQARDAKTLTELVTSFARLSPEKFAAYANAVYAISKETGAELTAMVQKQVAESNAQMGAAIEALAKNPQMGMGTPPNAADFITQSMNAAREAYSQMEQNARQFTAQASQFMPGAAGGSGRGKKA